MSVSAAAKRTLEERPSTWTLEDVRAVARAYLETIETLREIADDESYSYGADRRDAQEWARRVLAEHDKET